MIKNLSKPFCWTYIKNQKATERFNSTVSDIEIIKNADIIVGAVGIPKFIKSDWIKKGAVVIDAGYHPEKCGDIDLDNIEKIASAYTPVPGGVGPMTINTLILQTLQSAERAASN